MAFRTESDSIGSKQIPAEAYYGVQSLRGAENFHITGAKLHPEFINKSFCVEQPSGGRIGQVHLRRHLPGLR